MRENTIKTIPNTINIITHNAHRVIIYEITVESFTDETLASLILICHELNTYTHGSLEYHSSNNFSDGWDDSSVNVRLVDRMIITESENVISQYGIYIEKMFERRIVIPALQIIQPDLFIVVVPTIPKRVNGCNGAVGSILRYGASAPRIVGRRTLYPF